MATITGTIFMRTREAPTSLLNGQNFISVSFFSVMFLFFNGQTELTIAVGHLHILPAGAFLKPYFELHWSCFHTTSICHALLCVLLAMTVMLNLVHLVSVFGSKIRVLMDCMPPILEDKLHSNKLCR